MFASSPDNRKVALVMVGLPARGKSYTAHKVSRYLTWRGYRTRVFNVGEYRRAKLGAYAHHNFFDPDNPDGFSARRKLAMAALEDLSSWLADEGDVGIYDATNTTRARRELVREHCEAAGFQVLFVEMRCDDPVMVEANIRTTKATSPDYTDVDPEEAVRDFRARISHYEGVYQPIEDDEGSYIRTVNAGERFTVSNVNGYLAARIVFFLMNTHLGPRPIWLTRHGESAFNVTELLGGDPDLSPRGQEYAHSLADLLGAHFPEPDGVRIWTSSLRRAVQTANPLGRPSLAWRALDEIDAGICDGMTYEQVQAKLPDEYEARAQDKFRYRYPRGESYMDVIQRLEPVIIELERTRLPVMVIAHQAVLRALYAYFTGLAPDRCPFISVPLHTVIRLTPHAYGCNEERTPLPPHVESSSRASAPNVPAVKA